MTRTGKDRQIHHLKQVSSVVWKLSACQLDRETHIYTSSSYPERSCDFDLSDQMTRLGELQWFTRLKYLPFLLHPYLGGCEVSAFTKMYNSERNELTTKKLPFFGRFHPSHNSPLHKNWTYHCLLFQLILKPLGWSLNTGQRWCQICAESPQWCEMWNSARHWRKNVWRDHSLGVPSWKNFQFFPDGWRIINVTLPPIIIVYCIMGVSPVGPLPFKYSQNLLNQGSGQFWTKLIILDCFAQFRSYNSFNGRVKHL